MNDERLYAHVVEELQQAGPIAGLWAKAFADAAGVDATAKALYLRYRVSQLAELESQAAKAKAFVQAERRKLEAARAAEVRRLEAQNQEEEKRARAKMAGFTGIHWILMLLPVLMILALVIGSFTR